MSEPFHHYEDIINKMNKYNEDENLEEYREIYNIYEKRKELKVQITQMLKDMNWWGNEDLPQRGKI